MPRKDCSSPATTSARPASADVRQGEALSEALPGGARFDEKAGSLMTAAGEKVLLTRNESRILSLLIRKKGAIASREEIMLALWDSDEFVDDNTLTVNINRLRKTLEKAGVRDAIATHKGQGYKLNA